MEVLQTIHTHGDSRSTQTWNSLPSSQESDIPLSHLKREEISIVDSDDEDKADEKRNQFGSHISSFCFKPGSISLQRAGTSTPLNSDKQSSGIQSVARVATTTSIKRPCPQLKPLQEATSVVSTSSPSCSAPTKLPDLPDSLVTTLRGFVNCPLCLQPFPVLSVNGEASTKRAISKKAAAKKAATKTRKAITGAARLTHVRICAFRTETSSEVVVSLIAREQIRLDRNKRQEYNEEVSNQGVWKTVTGDAPPSTQVQRDSVKARGKRRGKVVAAKPQNGKAVAPSVVFKAGKRGGLNRATTLIMAPRLTRALVKQRCVELFGMPESSLGGAEDDEAVYDDHEESTTRCQRAASSGTITLGLGVGACSLNRSDHEVGAVSRLGMGYSLGTVIARRFMASH